MVLIEMFDRTPVDNIITTLALKPDRTVFLSTDIKKACRALPGYRRICDGRGIKTDFSVKGVSKNDLEDVTDALCDIITDPQNQKSQIVVDISGGDDGTLVAVGMILGMYCDDRIHAFRINPISRRGILYDYTGREDGRLKIERRVYDFSYNTQVYLTCEENIILHGGKLVSHGLTFDINEPVCGDVEALWDICRADPAGWNHKINRLSAAVIRFAPDSDARILPKSAFTKTKNGVDRDLWEKFVDGGFVRVDRKKSGGDSIFFRFKNKLTEECLTKAGSILEYRTYLGAKRAKVDDDGDVLPMYGDVQVSVVIGWDEDGEYSAGDKGTQNEIDCMVMAGVQPIFISCKNGDFKSDELYKLQTVSKEFGSEYAKAALLSTVYFDEESGVWGGYGGNKTTSSLKDRAGEMGIRLLSSMHKTSPRKFDECLEKL